MAACYYYAWGAACYNAGLVRWLLCTPAARVCAWR